MHRQLCLRWNERRTRYRPAGELFQPRDHEVSVLDRATAKRFVLEHHYSGTFPAGRVSLGLHDKAGQLVGVAVFSHPVNDRVFSCFPCPPDEAVELGRFVLVDSVAGNGETWFLGRAFAHLRREGFQGVVSFSDPVPRTDISGNVIHPGHIGTIYQAHNAVYLGRSTPRTLRLLPSGAVLSERSIQKVRARERGHQSVVAAMVASGAKSPTTTDALDAWMTTQLSRLTRLLPHPGNHKYIWALDRRVASRLPAGARYPSQEATAVSD